MPNFLSFLLLLCFSGIVHAQSLTFEFAGGPTMAHRIYTAEEPYKKAFDEERPMLSYEAGVRMFYSLNEHWRIGGGILYARKGFCFEPLECWQSTLVERKMVTSFLELPVIARYILKEKDKFSLYAQSGLGPSFCLRERIVLGEPINFNGQAVQEFNTTGDLRSVNLAFHAGFGASYRLTDGWQLGVEPAFNSHLLPMFPSGEYNYNAAVQRRLFSVGLNLVASYTW